MTEVVKYVADDGTEFDDECDCREYEWQQSVEGAEYTLLNGNFTVLDNGNNHSYDDAEYIFIPNLRAVKQLYNAWDGDFVSTYRPEFLDRAWNYTGDFNCETGLWAYDWDREDWFHLGSKIAELQKQANEVMARINGIGV